MVMNLSAGNNEIRKKEVYTDPAIETSPVILRSERTISL